MAKGGVKAAALIWAAFINVAALTPVYAENKQAQVTPAVQTTSPETAFDRGYEAEMSEDYRTARAEYKIACDDGEMMGCFNLAVLNDLGKGAERDSAEANRLYHIACDGDEPLACNNLGSNYRHGDGLEKDLVKARALYEKACKGGDGLGCSNVGGMMLPEGDYDKSGKHDKVYAEAFASFRKGCELENEIACAQTGYALLNGEGVKKDEKAAFSVYSKLCEKEHGTGCYNIGIIYEFGKSVPKSVTNAMRYYDLACTNAESEGCVAMADFYLDGDAVTKDALKAAPYLEKSCDLERAESCNDLASFYMDEETLPVDYAAADKFYAKSCELDDAAGCAFRAYAILLRDEDKLADGTSMIEAKKSLARSNALEKDNDAALQVAENLAKTEKLINEYKEKKSLTEKVFGR